MGEILVCGYYFTTDCMTKIEPIILMNPAAPYNILLIMQLVNMEQYSWLMEDTHLKEGWKSV